jgi:hypothetical protein
MVVESHESSKPIGIVVANDILQLRRWLMEEESHERRAPDTGKPKGTPRP